MMRKHVIYIFLLLLLGCNDDNKSIYEKYLIPKDKTFKSISLPFSSKEYIDEYERDEIYPFYSPSDFLVNYLISIDYEGEEYKCYVLPKKDKDMMLLVWILRGDSEYYLLMQLNSEKIITYKEIGKGGDDSILFIIKEDFSIDTL